MITVNEYNINSYENFLDWMDNAHHWARFSYIASLGIIHKGKHAKS